MGGYGSGWRRASRTTVEECLALSAGKLTEGPRKAASPNWSGHLTWSRNDEVLSRIGFTLWFHGSTGTANLRYTRTAAKDEVDEPVELTTTPLPWGGVRWWFTCPLVKAGHECRRRVGKLYLPPGGRYFGCRHCYDLTYESTREAHRFDALFAQLGRPCGMTARQVAKQFRDERKQEERWRRWLERRQRASSEEG